ncbi:hypothetical protein CH276_11265 [Rhodococcus sp. 06-470-2]|uniref:maltokinase N-terminal cap-like domain-containing protein n=1 Tax=unclassified Rhodococcus (in: high G+C Gram-positive bacteria) TaxID=192944 RepID=UPI000B9C0D25|nr:MULTISPECIES: hypothetical protein [unclassified Rhodococcus (in: high G+C Gram-positive bacteria)]OZC65752.1 hypothetical protein CH276_11265 [Rhodococcus sp. 06-470-2]OZE12870.1 hypothetical protein CH249_08450 [Rhodococcus sp. 05-2255-3B1]OZE14581.1 hypothetical protein CH250_05140 [Rhodococcus sp. 05-2255-3C]OZE22323.1 hypothetical protein CH255_05860 [Rhodococcus sp. 05-2255-2A2]OZE71011.1 hypothetical protein CH265_04050 [Rhodococcus sp. 05-2221-1B]
MVGSSSSVARTIEPQLEDALAAWLPGQRWFGAKGSTVGAVRIVARDVLLDEPHFAAEHLLVEVQLTQDGTAVTQTYQVPLGFRTELTDDLRPWTLPVAGEVAVFDGLRDPEIIGLYGDALAAGKATGSIEFKIVDGSSVPSGLRGRVLGAEQSNTSVILGDLLLLKLFRQVPPGISPDVELHRALAAAGSVNVAPLRGWLEAEVGGEPTTLGMAQDFAANSAEGWTAALASVQEVFDSPQTPIEELPADFASDAHRIGAAVAQVHHDLASELGTAERSVESTAVEEILARISGVARVVPEIAQYIPAATALISRAEASNSTTVQRIHGDLHLGQVLGTPERWLLIDFEGEPAKTLAERRQMDSALRDVAGMLRSFDYAANHLLVDRPEDESARERAEQWAARSISAFFDGYASVAGHDPRDEADLLRAYELDKAVYEVLYEARNRPTWLSLPMRAVARLVS